MGITTIGSHAFSGNGYYLKSIILPDSITTIGYYAFNYCRGLITITLPHNLTTINSTAFTDCNRLIEVCNQSSLSITAGGGSNGYVGYYAKNVYTNAEDSNISIDANNFVTYNDNGNILLLEYNGNNTNIILPNTISSIYFGAFANNQIVEDIDITSNVLSFDDYAFSNSKVATISIPSTITSIGMYAFAYSKDLTLMSYGSTESDWNNISKGSYWDSDAGTYNPQIQGRYIIRCTDGDIIVN